MKKLIYVWLDGAADLPCPQLGNKTPLQAAKMPNLTTLVKNGSTGIVQVLGRELAYESDVAAFALLGYDPLKYYSEKGMGRGALEALAAGIRIGENEIALRCNLAFEKDGRLISCRIFLDEEESKQIEKEINEKVKISCDFIFKFTKEYRAVLILKGRKFSAMISNTHPGYVRKGIESIPQKIPEFPIVRKCRPLENTKEAIETAEIVNEFIEKSNKVLNESEVNKKRIQRNLQPANYIITRNASTKLPELPDLTSLYKVLWVMIADTPVEEAIAKLTGMDLIVAEGNIEKARETIKALDLYDCALLHIKGADKWGHLGDPLKKKEALEKIDEEFFGNLVPSIDLNETVVCVTCDHATPCSLGAHSGDPVPILITGKYDGSEKFDEISCSKGSLGKMNGVEVMPLLMKIIKNK